MIRLEPAVRRKLAAARVARFATVGGGGPALVPICFVLLDATIYHIIDAKPKTAQPMQLRRVRNILANPAAAVLVDQYTENWTRLWFVLAEGSARLLRSGEEYRRARAALRRKYPQYRAMALAAGAPIIALDVGRLRHWESAAPRDRRPGSRRTAAARRSALRRALT